MMELGHGFVVTVQDESVEKDLMKLFAERIENYPIICKIKTPTVKINPETKEKTTVDPMEYFIASRDGCFLKFDDPARVNDVPLGLYIREADLNDVWKIRNGFKYCHQKPLLDALKLLD